jgi:hypothetical protein
VLQLFVSVPSLFQAYSFDRHHSVVVSPWSLNS